MTLNVQPPGGVAAPIDVAQLLSLKTALGVEQLDNTSDVNKPVSTAQAAALTAHTSDVANPHAVTKTQVGLSNVDNTSDALKPVSNAAAAADAAVVASSLQKSGGTMTGPIVLSGPATLATHPVTKQQLDDGMQGLKGKGSANYRTTAALPANTYANGALGVGATLTANANGALSVDGTAVVAGDVLAVGDEVASLANGLYVVTAPGDAGTPYVLTRASNMDVAAEFAGAFIVITGGATLAGASYYATFTGAFTVGTTAFTWTKNSAAMASTDALAEGATNLYFTAARVRAVVLTGIDLVTNAAVAATDSVMVAIGKLSARLEALITTVAGKADALAAADIATGAVAVTKALHLNRPLDCPGTTTATFAGTATSGALKGDAFECQVGTAGSFTATGAITAKTGYTLTAGAGVLFTARYDAADDAFYSTTSAASSGGTSVVASLTPAADVASGSTAETVVWDITLPILTALSWVAAEFKYEGTGTGNKQWRLRLGGTGVDGSIVWNFGVASAIGHYMPSFNNQNSVSSQVGLSGNLNAIFGGTTTSNGTAAVNTGVAVHLYLTVVKTTGADVINMQGGKCRVD